MQARADERPRAVQGNIVESTVAAAAAAAAVAAVATTTHRMLRGWGELSRVFRAVCVARLTSFEHAYGGGATHEYWFWFVLGVEAGGGGCGGGVDGVSSRGASK